MGSPTLPSRSVRSAVGQLRKRRGPKVTQIETLVAHGVWSGPAVRRIVRMLQKRREVRVPTRTRPIRVRSLSLLSEPRSRPSALRARASAVPLQANR